MTERKAAPAPVGRAPAASPAEKAPEPKAASGAIPIAEMRSTATADPFPGDDLVMPEPETVERLARLLCLAAGRNPDKRLMGQAHWEIFHAPAMNAIIAHQFLSSLEKPE